MPNDAKRSKLDQWHAAEAQRGDKEFPNRHILGGPLKVRLICAAAGALVGWRACSAANRHDSSVPSWTLCVLGGAGIAMLAGEILMLFDRYRAARHHAGKAPLSRGSLILLAIFGAIAVFVIIAVVTIFVLSV